MIYVAEGFGRMGRASASGERGEGGGVVKMDPRGDRRRQSDYSLLPSFIFIFNALRLRLLSLFGGVFLVLVPRPTARLSIATAA